MKKVKIDSNGEKVAATLIYPTHINDTMPGCIFIHGWLSNQEGYIKRAKTVAELGIICLTIDLRGHGKSEGNLENLSRKDHLDDAIAAYGYLISLPNIDKNKIAAVGASYGGALAALLTSKRKIKWLGMRVPALFSDSTFEAPTIEVVKDEKRFFHEQESTQENSLTLKTISNFDGEILIVESEKDQIIPHKIIDQYINPITNKSRLTYKIMRGATHDLSTTAWKNEFIQILLKWFKKVIY